MADDTTTADRRPSRLARGALIAAVVFVVIAVLAGFGTRLGVWGFEVGLLLLAVGVVGELIVLLASLLALRRVRRDRRPGTASAAVALAISGVVVAIALSTIVRGAGAPAIHDVTTDTANPPELVAIAPLRADAPNPSTYGGPDVAAQQRAAWPDLRPALIDLPPERAFQRALDVARAFGWEIVSADPASLRIEATDRTFWFGFRDDVVVRLTPAGARTVVDVRSVSRVGKGDLGTNARRIRAYLDALDD
jgi:uncharacterized protein (DUF1499 family)